MSKKFLSPIKLAQGATNPTTGSSGELFFNTTDLKVYAHNGTTWLPSAGGVTVSDTAPTTPVNGDMWWKSNDGTLFTYYNDGDTSQWVESTNVIANVEPNPIPAGAIMAWGSNTIPANWLLCDGTAISRSTYASLFAIIGTQYGVGDGSTTFNLPNLKGRTIVARDSTQTEFDVLGETGGAKTHTLTISEMPSHTHVQNSHTHTFSGTTDNQNQGHTHTYSGTTAGDGGHRHNIRAEYGTNANLNNAPPGWYNQLSVNTNWAMRTDYTQNDGNHTHTFSGTTSDVNQGHTHTYSGTTAGTTATNQSTGGDGAHNNLQPYIVLNYIIKHSAGETPGDSQLAVRVGAVEAANNATPLSPNYVINGAMDIWQRGTSGTQSAGGGANCVSVDRWKAASYGSAPAITIARSADIPSGVGATYSAAISWASSTSTGDVFSSYFIEDGKYRFAGKTVTVSFYAKATNAVSAGASFDQDYAGTNFSLTTSWTRYAWTLTLPSNYQSSPPSGTSSGNHVELRLFRMANVSAAANTIYFTGVQVEEGSYATPFRRNTNNVQAELAACQRYYWRWAYQSSVPISGTAYPCYAWSATDVRLAIPHPVEMRKNPVTTLTGVANFAIFMAGTSVGASAGSMDWPSPNSTHYIFTVTGRTAGQAGWVNLNGSGGSLEFSAEF